MGIALHFFTLITPVRKLTFAVLICKISRPTYGGSYNVLHASDECALSAGNLWRWLAWLGVNIRPGGPAGDLSGVMRVSPVSDSALCGHT